MTVVCRHSEVADETLVFVIENEIYSELGIEPLEDFGSVPICPSYPDDDVPIVRLGCRSFYRQDNRALCFPEDEHHLTSVVRVVQSVQPGLRSSPWVPVRYSTAL